MKTSSREYIDDIFDVVIEALEEKKARISAENNPPAPIPVPPPIIVPAKPARQPAPTAIATRRSASVLFIVLWTLSYTVPYMIGSFANPNFFSGLIWFCQGFVAVIIQTYIWEKWQVEGTKNWIIVGILGVFFVSVSIPFISMGFNYNSGSAFISQVVVTTFGLIPLAIYQSRMLAVSHKNANLWIIVPSLGTGLGFVVGIFILETGNFYLPEQIEMLFVVFLVGTFRGLLEGTQIVVNRII